MKSTYIASTTEAANLHIGNQTAIVTLVKPQPIPANADKTAYNFDMRNSKHFHMANNVSVEDMNTHFRGILDFAPYQPGQTIAVRETMYELGHYYTSSFDESGEYETVWFSKGKYIPSCNGVIAEKHRVISAARMPREAIRTHLLVKDVFCARVQDFFKPTYEQLQSEYLKMGITEYKLSQPTGVNGTEVVYDWQIRNGMSDKEMYENCLLSARSAFTNMVVAKFGHCTWDDNEFVFITKVEKI